MLYDFLFGLAALATILGFVYNFRKKEQGSTANNITNSGDNNTFNQNINIENNTYKPKYDTADIARIHKIIRIKRWIFHPLGITGFLMLINSFLLEAYYSGDNGFRIHAMINEGIANIYTYFPPLRWTAPISPVLDINFTDLTAPNNILLLFTIALIIISFNQIGNTKTLKRRIREAKEAAENERFKNSFRDKH